MRTHVQDRLIQCFSFLCIPLACWQMWLFPRIPNYHLQHFFIYPVALYMLWLVCTAHIRIFEVAQRWCPYIPLALSVVGVQGFALWHYSPPEASLPRYVVISLAKIVVQWPFFLIFAELCRFTIQKHARRRACMWGCLCASGFLLSLCAIQGVYIYTVGTSHFFLQTAHAHAKQLLLTVSPYLEARWLDAVYDFYFEGAYSLTILRINGLFEETSSLSAWVGTLFLPVAFGFLGIRDRSYKVLGLTLSVAWILLLFFMRGTGAQLVGIAALGVLLCLSLQGSKKMLTFGIACLCVGICLTISFSIPQVNRYLLGRMQLSQLEAMPRVVIMLDTLDIIAKYPLTGVGRGNFSSHIVKGKRYQKYVGQDPELQAWKKAASVPPLSALLGFTAQYGIPLLLLMLGSVAHLWFKVYQRWRRQAEIPLVQFTFTAFTAWCVLAFIACMGSLDLRNPLLCLPVFFFMAVAQGVDDAAT